MEVLEVSGYVSEEKCKIAEQYLGPQAKEASGLKDADVQLDPSAIDVLIKYYARESGVRNLKKHIEKVRADDYVFCIATCSHSHLDLPQGCPEAHSGLGRGCVPRGDRDGC